VIRNIYDVNRNILGKTNGGGLKILYLYIIHLLQYHFKYSLSFLIDS